jgi:NADPH:quinone reductase-like Zn-dependent oxidoreductase
MKAALLQSRGRDGLVLRDIPIPVRAPGDVLVQVHAAGLNRVDLYMRDSGVGITHTLPQTMGVEAAGVVVETDSCSRLKTGQKVVVYSNAFCGACRYCRAGDQPLCLQTQIMGEHRDGGFAQYIVMPERCMVPLPEQIDLVDAAVLQAAYVTAWRMLFGKRALRPGETVLVVGIGGGVAVACLQLARHAGARVLVTSSSDAKLARASELGASGGINYRREKVASRVLEMTNGEGVDMVIDSSGAASWDDSLRSLRRGGRLVTCGATTGSNPGADIQRLFIRQLEVYGSTGGSLDEFRELIALVAAGGIKPVIDRCFTLDELPAAFDRLQNGEQFGKVVITMTP